MRKIFILFLLIIVIPCVSANSGTITALIPNQTLCEGQFTMPCANAYDGDWSSAASNNFGTPDRSNITINYSLPRFLGKELNWTYNRYAVSGISSVIMRIYNFTSNSWDLMAYHTTSETSTLNISGNYSDYINNSVISFQIAIDNSGLSRYYESSITYEAYQYPYNVTLVNPSNNSIIASIKPTFNWTYMTDNQGKGYNFTLEVANDSSFKTINLTKILTTDNYTMTGIGGENLSAGTWFWRVNATIDNLSRFSDNYTFTIDTNRLFVNIAEPTGSKTSKTINYIVVLDNSSAISSCFYIINYSTGVVYKDKVNLTCDTGSNTISNTFTVDFDTNYIFFFSANNTNATQVRSFSSSNFTVSPAGDLGGGGGSGGAGASINPEAWTVTPTMFDQYLFFYLPSYNATKQTEITITSNLKIYGCYSPYNECTIKDTNKAIVRINVDNPNNNILAEQNFTVKLQNEYGQIKDIDGKERIINLGFYFPTNEISVSEGSLFANPYLFEVDKGNMIGIRIYVLAFALIILLGLLRYLRY